MPNPFVTRALAVVYGTGGTAQTIGGTSKLVLEGVYKLDLKYATGSFRCRFWVAEATDAAFITTCQGIEANLTLPRGRLQIQVNGVNQEDFNPDPAINTGFNQRVQLTKPDDPMNTTRVRVYEWLCEFDRPAVLAGQAGRLESTQDLSVEPGGRRRFKFSGTYTALTTNSARAQYAAAIGTPAYNGGVGTGILGTLTASYGGSWEIVNTPQAAVDDTNKLLRFSIELRDLLLSESISLLHDPDLTDQVLTTRRTWVAPGDSPTQLAPVPTPPPGAGNPQSGGGGGTDLSAFSFGLSGSPIGLGGQSQGGGASGGGGGSTAVRRLQTLDVEYSVWVTNRAVNLRTKWEGAILPWILKHVTTVAQLSVFAVTRVAPQFDYVNSRISASITFLAPNGSNVLTQTITTSDHTAYGWIEAPVWSGDVNAKYLFQGPQRITRTINFSSEFVGGPTQPPPSPAAKGYTLLDRDVSNTALLLGGFAGLGQFSVCKQVVTEVWVFSTAPPKPQAPSSPSPGRTATGVNGNGSGLP